MGPLTSTHNRLYGTLQICIIIISLGRRSIIFLFSHLNNSLPSQSQHVKSHSWHQLRAGSIVQVNSPVS